MKRNLPYILLQQGKNYVNSKLKCPLFLITNYLSKGLLICKEKGQILLESILFLPNYIQTYEKKSKTKVNILIYLNIS